MRPMVALAAAVLAATVGCKGDRILAGRSALSEDPDKAIALFQEAEKERSPCFDCQIYTGLAYEKKGDLAAAIAAYEKAAAMPDAATRPEPVTVRLYETYRKQFEKVPDGAARDVVARKAATLETSLKVDSAWANLHLFEGLQKQVDAAAAQGDDEAVRTAEKAIQALYLPVEKKRKSATDATEALRQSFVKRGVAAFQAKLAGDFVEKDRYDADSRQLVLRNTFEIPSMKDDEKFDPESEDFKTEVRKASCLPLRKTLDEVIDALVPVLGVKKPNETDVDRLFGKLFSYAKAGFGVHNGEKKPPAGLPYVCFIEVPLDAFVAEFFRFSE